MRTRLGAIIRNRISAWPLAALIVLASPALVAAEPAAWYDQGRELYFGIPVRVSFTPADEALAAKAWALFEGVDPVFNDYHADSEIGRINAAPPGDHQLSNDLADAFEMAARVNQLTDGAFDITVGPLRRLWRQAEKDGHRPDPAAIVKARALVGKQGYSLENGKLHVSTAGCQFDFGGLIKGMAVDRVIALLRDAHVDAALVQCGGETACFGMSQRGKPHALGIPNPDHQETNWCVVEDQGQGFCGSTSGNYRNAIVIDGAEYYHIFDPRTGEPANTHVLSASVVFTTLGNNGLADGIAKLGVLEPDRFLTLVASLGGEGMVLIRKSGGAIEQRTTDGWAKVLRATSQTPETKP